MASLRRLFQVITFWILLAVTALSAPVDCMVGRRLRGASWHKLFVLERAPSDGTLDPSRLRSGAPG